MVCSDCQDHHSDEGSRLFVVKPGGSNDKVEESLRGSPLEDQSRGRCVSPLVAIACLFGIVALVRRAIAGYTTGQSIDDVTKLRVAFVGNSMFYFNGMLMSIATDVMCDSQWWPIRTKLTIHQIKTTYSRQTFPASFLHFPAIAFTKTPCCTEVAASPHC